MPRLVVALYVCLLALPAHGRALQSSNDSVSSADGTQEVVTFELLANLPRLLRETSGVATSRRQPGILWTHNDSGHGPYLYAMDYSGSLVARFRVQGAGSNDWEDIGRGPCPASVGADGDCLYLADTGNNDGARRLLSVYVVLEPDATTGSAARPVDGRTAGARIRFRYPEARIDAEALAVTPDGDLLIVNKGRHRDISVYSIGAAVLDQAIQDAQTVEAESLGRLPFLRDRANGRVVTGATYSATGDTLIVRTYTGIRAFRNATDGWVEVGSCRLGWREPAGEGIDYLDENSFVLTSEAGSGRPATLHRVRCDLGG